MDAAPQKLSATPARMPDFLREEALRSGERVSLDAGQYYFHTGQSVDVFAVLETGSLRVFSTGANGREITLYGVEPGECCLVNVLCLMSGVRSPATAVAEESLTAVQYSRAQFLDWIHDRADMRAFVFGIMAERVSSMMSLVEEIAFQRLDCRLAGYLCQRTAGESDSVTVTHDAIANELGTAREVVSRLLKTFERRGAVGLARGTVTVRDRDFLQRLAHGIET
jgi:CRP/FNR family transcriptional regulator